MDRTAAGLEPHSCTDGHLLCRSHARVTPPVPDVKGKMNGSAALDIHSHWRYVVEKAAAGFSRLPPRINFALFAPQMVFTRNLGLTQTLAFYAFPQLDARKISSTNVLERLNREIRRRTNVVEIFPNPKAYTRLVTTYLMEYAEDWASSRAYLNEQAVQALLSPPA